MILILHWVERLDDLVKGFEEMNSIETLLVKAEMIGNNHESGKKYVYAVYSETDGSLKFYNREKVPDDSFSRDEETGMPVFEM